MEQQTQVIGRETSEDRERKSKQYFRVKELFDPDKYYKRTIDVVNASLDDIPRGIKSAKKGYVKGSVLIKDLEREIEREKYGILKGRYYPLPDSRISKEQEREFFSFYQLSLKHDCLEVQRDIQGFCVSSNIGLVRTAVKKLVGNSSPHLDDLLQEGRLKLAGLMEKFNPRLGVCFSTFACFALRRKLIQELNKMSRRDGVYLELKEEHDWLDKREPYSGLERVEIRMIVRASLDCLTKRERRVIEHSYELDGKKKLSQSQIAIKWGISKQRVDQLKTRAFKKLRWVLRPFREYIFDA